MPLVKSRYSRQQAFPPDFTDCRNNPDRTLVETMRTAAQTRSKPWLTEKQEPPVKIVQHHVVPRSPYSSFCVRPGDIPITK